jgi:hypothetical protein
MKQEILLSKVLLLLSDTEFEKRNIAKDFSGGATNGQHAF